MFTSRKNTCQNNSEKSHIEKKATNRPSGYSLVTCCSFDKSKNERNYYRGKDVRMKIIKKNLKKCKKSEIIVITHENIEELLIVFAIYAAKYRKRFV